VIELNMRSIVICDYHLNVITKVEYHVLESDNLTTIKY